MQQNYRFSTESLEAKILPSHPQYMLDYCPNIEKDFKLDAIFREENPLDRVYVYWVVDGRRIKPAIIANSATHRDFEEDLRNTYGAFEYDIMVRRKRIMICTHRISFANPLEFIPEKDIRAEIKNLRDKKRKTSRARK